MRGYIKALFGIMFVFLILFVAGCGGGKGDKSDGGKSGLVLGEGKAWINDAEGFAVVSNNRLMNIFKVNGDWYVVSEGMYLLNENSAINISDGNGNLVSSGTYGISGNTLTLLLNGKMATYMKTGGINISKNRNDTESGQSKTINGIECVLVKAGVFFMGSPMSENERGDDEVQHPVVITQDYYISKYPITNAQFGKSGNANDPVVNVIWTEANDWAKSKGGRLPTEAEWEFAARGGNKSQGYIYSGSNTIGNVAWHSGNSDRQTHPVGQKQSNELGIYDMSGNVWEWCSDFKGDYPTEAVTNPTGTSAGYFRVLRGGSWIDPAQNCRVAARRYDHPNLTIVFYGDFGFRVAFPAN